MYEIDKERMEQAYDDFEKNWTGDQDIEKEYLHFSQFIQSLFISKEGWIILTGDYRVANYELLWEIKDKIERHPFIWRFIWKHFMLR